MVLKLGLTFLLQKESHWCPVDGKERSGKV